MAKIANVEFELNIDSGNAAMVDDHRSEIADMLEETARKIRECYTDGMLMDTNGNKVGSWSLELEEDDDEDEEKEDDDES